MVFYGHLRHSSQLGADNFETTEPESSIGGISSGKPKGFANATSAGPPAVVLDEVCHDGRKTNPRKTEGRDQDADGQGSLHLEPGPKLLKSATVAAGALF